MAERARRGPKPKAVLWSDRELAKYIPHLVEREGLPRLQKALREYNLEDKALRVQALNAIRQARRKRQVAEFVKDLQARHKRAIAILESNEASAIASALAVLRGHQPSSSSLPIQ